MSNKKLDLSAMLKWKENEEQNSNLEEDVVVEDSSNKLDMSNYGLTNVESEKENESDSKELTSNPIIEEKIQENSSIKFNRNNNQEVKEDVKEDVKKKGNEENKKADEIIKKINNNLWVLEKDDDDDYSSITSKVVVEDLDTIPEWAEWIELFQNYKSDFDDEEFELEAEKESPIKIVEEKKEEVKIEENKKTNEENKKDEKSGKKKNYNIFIFIISFFVIITPVFIFKEQIINFINTDEEEIILPSDEYNENNEEKNPTEVEVLEKLTEEEVNELMKEQIIKIYLKNK